MAQTYIAHIHYQVKKMPLFENTDVHFNSELLLSWLNYVMHILGPENVTLLGDL